jgi:hypothetical protein
VNLYEFIHLLSGSLGGDETVMTDAGQPHPAMAQAFRHKDGQRYLNPGSLAEMGWALPAATGVAAADPHRRVVVVVGDGSLQTNIQELQTVSHHRPNLKLFVINNGGYLSIRNTQRSFFKGFLAGSSPETGSRRPWPQPSSDARSPLPPQPACRQRRSSMHHVRSESRNVSGKSFNVAFGRYLAQAWGSGGTRQASHSQVREFTLAGQ